MLRCNGFENFAVYREILVLLEFRIMLWLEFRVMPWLKLQQVWPVLVRASPFFFIHHTSHSTLPFIRSFFQLSRLESRMTLRTVLTNEQTVEAEEEKDLISMSCLSKYVVALKCRVISEKIRRLIRFRKVLETIRSSRRALDGRWSKIEEMISWGMYNLGNC